MINGNTFKDLGYVGEEIGLCLYMARTLVDMSDEEIVDYVKRSVTKAPPKLKRLQHPKIIKEAITPRNDDEFRNYLSASEGLTQLATIPVVKSAAMMPDACPAASGDAAMCVGGVIEVMNAIIPAAHSADICCSMHSTFFYSDLNTKEMLRHLKDATRFGPGGRDPADYVHSYIIDEFPHDNYFLKGLEDYARKHMADQGDGNHFAYLGEIETSRDLMRAVGNITMAGRPSTKALVTHHGSRGLGALLYKRGLKTAITETNKIADGIPPNGAWLSMDSDIGKEYWEALQYVSKWTAENHNSIHRRFLENIGGLEHHDKSTISNEHNFVWKRDGIYYHGKGATPSFPGEYGLIPMNMSENILIVKGKGNDYLNFAPHGAGRNVSRTTIKKRLHANGKCLARTVEENTKDIEVVWYQGKPDVTETGIAYKKKDDIVAEIRKYDLCDIIGEIKPLGCIMAGEPIHPPSWKRSTTK